MDNTFPIRPAHFDADTAGMSDADIARIRADIACLTSDPAVASFGLRGAWVDYDADTVYYYGVGVIRYEGGRTEYLWPDYTAQEWKAVMR